MKTTQRLASVSILSALIVALVPVTASAQEVGTQDFGPRFENQHRGFFSRFRANRSSEDGGQRRFGRRPGHNNKHREAIKEACGDIDKEDKEARRECAYRVRLENADEDKKPIIERIHNECKDSSDRREYRACVRTIKQELRESGELPERENKRKNIRQAVRGLDSDARAELRSKLQECRDGETRDEVRSCIAGVLSEILE